MFDHREPRDGPPPCTRREKSSSVMSYFDSYSEGMTWGEYLSSKFDDFVFDPKLRNLFGQKRSTIDMGDVMDRRQTERARFETELRAQASVPAEAVTLAVSLDGVMVPMKDGARAHKRKEAKTQDKRTRGQAGYSEVGCGTLSYYDAEGQRLKKPVLGGARKTLPSP